MITTHDALELVRLRDDDDPLRLAVEQLLADRQTMRECMADDIAMLNSIASGEQFLPVSVNYVAGLHQKVLERIGK